MIAILIITGLMIIFYLAYPLWLLLIPTIPEDEAESDELPGVSLVLLSYDGKKFLEEKIDFLIRELSAFPHYELIIIDDNSTDGSQEILESLSGLENIQIICKSTRKGIPDSMNTAVKLAKFEYIIFCDQRQKLCENIIQRLVRPLSSSNVGAVSACISHLDNRNRYSLIRKFENLIKCRESSMGSLIGVYGPLYAIKKCCYVEIPENIILDDLYLSLRILKSKQVRLIGDCRIIDENFTSLNDYKRARRYVAGFLQIIKAKSLISELSLKQRIMLAWHKFIRLFIPVCLFLCYVISGFLWTKGVGFIMIFIVLTLLGLIALMPGNFRFKSLLRINIFYFIAMMDVLLNKILVKK